MFLTMVPLLLAATGSPDPAWQRLWEQCRAETSPALRLACYDALSREAGRSGVISPPDGKAATAGGAFQLGREAGSGDLTLTRLLADGNVLVIGCASNITHVRLTLGRPWAGETVSALLDGVTASDNWFVRNRGLLLEFSRGLPAIEALKRWVGHRELALSDAQGNALRIDLAGLGEALTPLRQQCRW
ncbi:MULTISPECIES: type VI secretion system-associated protein VasI [Brenneria]|uniref:Type VI secretion system-associated protein TagO n=1 Tax=Brenneria nigrifluens DSM 30175 = ATCC 13028 TaxID=1121120 RepID=A0A2U1UK83_9GAMM|nr:MULTISPECIES: type VI secretion system-associated protein VasI [Brenneria]EHD20412.1 type VI secretion-associated protein, VC_A0118 family [Brenneria sp. EniD312]PWC22089.1 type VI secretion system-associated protein TagO [Brenneria nigrifluens DSM 30175 = ATCC 13028]QCR03615.1 type VI secretion system-associated protein TagO [Brenneria nigrifluens DSM 30175 = ATCC 13028]